MGRECDEDIILSCEHKREEVFSAKARVFFNVHVSGTLAPRKTDSDETDTFRSTYMDFFITFLPPCSHVSPRTVFTRFIPKVCMCSCIARRAQYRVVLGQSGRNGFMLLSVEELRHRRRKHKLQDSSIHYLLWSSRETGIPMDVQLLASQEML